MKYPLHNVLLNDNSILSHVFLNCVPTELAERIADESKEMGDEKAKDRKIEITMKIAGESVDPEKFFKLLSEQYDELLEREATKLMKEQLSDKFCEIQDKLNSFDQILEGWANEISWDVKNPFIKQP